MDKPFILNASHITMRFGGLTAINNVSFTAQPRHITSIIGPNGAGKTTLFNCLTGFYRPTAGQMVVCRDGELFDLHTMRGDKIARKARVARTFQNIRLFTGMTVLENLLVAQHRSLQRASQLTLGGLMQTPRYRAAHAAAIDFAAYWLDQVGLLHKANDNAGSLPYGDQRRLEIARALCTGPVLLCLDEPAAGLNPRESAELNTLLLRVRDEHGIAILLIEHDMSVVMAISDHILVLDYGHKIAEGRPDAIRHNPAVIKAYLGDDTL